MSSARPVDLCGRPKNSLISQRYEYEYFMDIGGLGLASPLPPSPTVHCVCKRMNYWQNPVSYFAIRNDIERGPHGPEQTTIKPNLGRFVRIDRWEHLVKYLYLPRRHRKLLYPRAPDYPPMSILPPTSHPNTRTLYV